MRGLIPGLGRSPGEGNGNPLQYSCLESLMNRGAWWATVHGVAKSWTQLKRFNSNSGSTLIYKVECSNLPGEGCLHLPQKEQVENHYPCPNQ